MSAVVSEEKSAFSPSSHFMRLLVTVIAVTMSLYHMYVAGFGPPEAVIFRGTHLMFAMTLVFLLFPTRRGGGLGWRSFDLLLLVLGLGGVLHVFFNYEAFTNRIIYIDDLTTGDTFWGVVMIFIVLESTRRIIGLALPLTALCFYGLRGVYLKREAARLTRAALSFHRGYLWLHAWRVGCLRHACLLFLVRSWKKRGTGRLFMDFSMSLTGKSAGGPRERSRLSAHPVFRLPVSGSVRCRM